MARLLHLTGHHAGTLPGRVMLKFDRNILAKLAADKVVVAVTGTNGKTTTTALIVEVLRSVGFRVATNASGANLLSGIVTAFTVAPVDTDIYVIEVDEATLGHQAGELKPLVLLVTNIFRDQLDRYGEVNTVYDLIGKGIEDASPENLILCVDDPVVANLRKFAGAGTSVKYYGLHVAATSLSSGVNNSANEFKTDMSTTSCPCCQNQLLYNWHTMSHLGGYSCTKCGYIRQEPEYSFSQTEDRRLRLYAGALTELVEHVATAGKPVRHYEKTVDFPLQGLFNAYNACAAVAVADTLLNCSAHAATALKRGDKAETGFLKLSGYLSGSKAAFGRQEIISLPGGCSLHLMLVKNPVGFSQTLPLLPPAEMSVGQKNTSVEDASVEGLQPKVSILFLLNSNVADSCDVSWIWDVPFEEFAASAHPVYVAGERGADLALRLTYAGYSLLNNNYLIRPLDLCQSIIDSKTSNHDFYIIANYTAMLSIRAALANCYHFSQQWSTEERL